MNAKRLVPLLLILISSVGIGLAWLRERADNRKETETAEVLRRQMRDTADRIGDVRDSNQNLTRELAENRLLRQKQIELNTLVPLQQETVTAPPPPVSDVDVYDTGFIDMLRTRRAQVKSSRESQIRKWAAQKMEDLIRYAGPEESPVPLADRDRLLTLLSAMRADPDTAFERGQELSEMLHRARARLLQQRLQNQGLSASEAAERTREAETLWRSASLYGFSILGVSKGERPGAPLVPSQR